MRATFGILCLLSLVGNPWIHAQPASPPASTNHVLELDGGYVELPPNIFNDLTEATVEAWVRWDDFSGERKRVFNYGDARRDFSITSRDNSPSLWFVMGDAHRKLHEIIVPNLLRAQQWCHVAAVSGPGGMKVYLNGALAGTKDYIGSFAGLETGNRFYLGQRVTTNEPPTNFKGGIDEVRVWKVERTEAQIRETMFRPLTGKEPGLAALWNFENVTNGVVKDAGPGHNDGKLAGDARIVVGQLPSQATLATQSWATSQLEMILPTPDASLTNHVLSLDGDGSYVELPPYCFTNLTEATVEGWVKWRTFRRYSRFFDFGTIWSAMSVCNVATTNTLYFSINRPPFTRESEVRLQLPGLIKLNEWCHIAAVTGAGGVRLYFNGALVGTHQYAGSFSALTNSAHNYLGRSNWREGAWMDDDFDGEMDEVRVWRVARSATQIHENMFKKLTGAEDGLVSLWNFENATNDLVKDAGPGRNDGKLRGEAVVIKGQLPVPLAARAPELRREVQNQTRRPVPGAVLEVSGENGHVEIGTTGWSPGAQFTEEAWILPSLSNLGTYHIFLGNDAGGRSTFLRPPSLWLLNRTGLHFGFGDGDNWFGLSTPTGIVIGGEWNHVAAVFDGNTYLIYVNGRLIFTGTEARNKVPVESSLVWMLGKGFAGQMDEVRVWSVARSELQIREAMGRKLSGTEYGLVSLWNFDEVKNGVVRDRGPGGHEGRLVGNAKVVSAATSLAAPAVAQSRIELSGTVTDSFGNAASNALVTVKSAGGELGIWRTDASGGYRFVLPELPGPIELSGKLNDESATQPGIVLRSGQARRVDLQLISPASIRGNVLDNDGRVLAAVLVQLLDWSADFSPLPAVATEVKRTEVRAPIAVALTHGDGSYHFRHVKAGRYVVRAQTADGFVMFDGGRAVEVKEDAMASGIDLRLPPRSMEGPSNSALTNLVFQRKPTESRGAITLPDHIFDELDEATIEGWLKSDDFNNHYFYSYGDRGIRMFIKNGSGNPNLQAAMDSRLAQNLHIDHNSFKSNEWFHVAWVTGKGGMRLYVNGVLAANNPSTASFSVLDNQARTHYLGTTASGSHGIQLDEWRVWVTQRTPEQIRDNMFRRLSGREFGLAALWNFDDPSQPGRDASPHGFHGTLDRGGAVVAGKLPNAVHGVVTDKDGRAVVNAQITFERDGQQVASTAADNLGRYLFAGPALDQPVTLFARKDELSCEGIELGPDGPMEVNLQLRDLARLSGRTLALDESPIPAVVIQALPVAKEDAASASAEPGLQAELFDVTNPGGFPAVPAESTPKLRRVDPQLDFRLARGSVAPAEFDSGFFARWTGSVRIEAERKYTFYLQAKRQARLFIDDAPVAESGLQLRASTRTNLTSKEGSGVVVLSTGFHTLKVEYYNGSFLSACQLFWSAEGLLREVVPARVLFHNVVRIPTMATTRSDANGKFRFNDLAPGKYTLRAQLPGQFVSLDNGREITLEKDQPVADQDFHFAPFKKGTWRHWSHLDGLAEDNVLGAFESASGELWFGTAGGVSRFDGKELTTFTKEDGLPDSQVRAIAEFPDGVMWFGTRAGLCRYSPSLAPAPALALNLAPPAETSMNKSKSKSTSGNFTTFTITNGLAGDNIQTLARDPSGALWIGTSSGLSRYDGRTFTNFYGRRAHDSGPAGLHGLMMGNATVVNAPRPSSAKAMEGRPELTRRHSSIPGQVLRLDGDGSYVALPSNIFNHLTNATIEIWVKFATAQQARLFNYGAYERDLGIGTDTERRGGLGAFVVTRPDHWERVWAGYLVRPGEWMHVALATGNGGMKLYCDGQLKGSNSTTASFAGLGNGEPFIVGREYSGHYLAGEIAELRVWSVARSAEEISGSMFTSLTGNEPNLAGLWKFENATNGVVKDISPGGHDGKLVGNARVVSSQRPSGPQPAESQPTAGPELALLLDGSGARLELPQNLLSDLEEFTFEGWGKWSRFNNWSGFLGILGSASKAFIVHNVETTNQIHLTLNEYQDGKWAGRAVDAGKSLQAGDWTHIALVGTRSNLSLCVDGTDRGTIPDRGIASLDGITSIQIGHNNFDGHIAGLRLWNRARKPEQIRATMYAKVTGREPGLVGLWNFDNVADGVVKDASPGGHDGKLVGNAAIIISSRPVAPPSVTAQTAAKETVLQLDGTNGYVELPSNIFNHLTSATIEIWVKFATAQRARIFNYGAFRRDLGIGTDTEDGIGLGAFVVTRPGHSERFRAGSIVRPGEWMHVALATGNGGMKLYCDGRLESKNSTTASFAGLGNGEPFTVGREHSGHYLAGEIAELRVWSVARSAEEISGSMFTSLTGNEPNLAGLWKFDSATNGVVKDLSPGGQDGKLVGNARVVLSQRPGPPQPTVLASNIAGSGTLQPVLQLDGQGSYVALPPQVFKDATNLTVEGWVRWEKFPNGSHFFEFGGPSNAIYVAAQANRTPVLSVRTGVTSQSYSSAAPVGMTPNEWQHIAAVFGLGGEKFYWNGNLLLNRTNTGHFESLRDDPRNFIGTCALRNLLDLSAPTDLQGQVDEFRVWGAERTAEEIRAGMFAEMTGKEAGLLGLWHFNLEDNAGLLSADVSALACDTNGITWIGTARGIARWDGKALVNYTTADGLAKGTVQAIHIAADRSVWFGTDGGGATHLTFGAAPSEVQSHEPPDDENPDAASLSPSDGERAGVRGTLSPTLSNTSAEGRNKVDDKVGDKVPASREGEKRPVPMFTTYTTRDGLPSDQITAITEDSAGGIWFAASPKSTGARQQSAAVARFDGKSFVTYSTADGLIGSSVQALRFDHVGSLWAATPSGVHRFDPQSLASFDSRDGLDAGAIQDIAATADHSVWFLADQKLSRFNGHEIQKMTQAEGLSGAPLNSLFVDTNQDLLVTAVGAPIAAVSALGNQFLSRQLRHPGRV